MDFESVPAHKKEWQLRFAFFPARMTASNKIVWLAFYETRWGRPWVTGGNSFWLKRQAGSRTEFPFKAGFCVDA